mgnify:CR=1 FL=1
METLKTGKPREQIFTMYSGYTTHRGLQHSSKVYQPHRALRAYCYSHSCGAAHASLYLSDVTRTHAYYSLFYTHLPSALYYKLKVCPSCIYTYTTFWLFTYLALMGCTFRLFTSIVSRVGYVHDSGFGLG